MLVVLGDTHRTDGHGLEGRSLSAVRAADAVAHTGDFTTERVYEAFAAAADRLHAVAGNNDEPALADRLPSRAVFEAEGLTVVLVHGHRHAGEALSLVGRTADADLVVHGHSHRPAVTSTPHHVRLNPGSHVQPRRFRRAHAELERHGDAVDGRLVAPAGEVIESFSITLGD